MNPQIWGFAALEIVNESLNLEHLRDKWLSKSDRLTPEGQSREQTSVKLSGSPLGRSRLKLRVFELDSFFGPGEYGDDSFRGATLTWSRAINPILLLSFSFDLHELDKSRKYKRLNSATVKSLVSRLLPEARIDNSHSVYTVIGTVAPETVDWPEGVNSGWVHIHGSRDGYLDSAILRQIITDTSIEKSLLNRVGNLPWRGLHSLFSAPRAARLIRKLPVQGLPDWGKVSTLRAHLRESMNFDAYRSEILENSKHWWTVVGVLSGLLALAAGLLSLSI